MRLAERERRERVRDLLRQLDLGVAGRVAAAGDHHVGLAALDRRGGQRDRLQARGARARDGHAFARARASLRSSAISRATLGEPRRQDHAAPHDRVDLACARSRCARAARATAATPSAIVSSFVKSVNAFTNGVRTPPTIDGARRCLAVSPLALVLLLAIMFSGAR